MGDDAVVITGMGSVCAAGTGVGALWECAAQGECRAQRFGGEGPLAEAPVYRVRAMPAVEAAGVNLRRADRCVLLALAAAREAAASARLGEAPVEAERLGVFFGSSRGPVGTWAESMRREASGERQPPTLLANGTFASVSGVVSVALGARGACATVSATCASAAHAIALAAEQVASGALDAAVAGAAEAPLHPAILTQFLEAGLLASHEDPARACRPFDRARNGAVLGEGAGALVLERLRSARARGARVLAVLAGWGLATDAAQRTATSEDGEGLQRAIRQACRRAGVEGSEVDYVNAHGTGTMLNDRAEWNAVAAAVREGVPCSSTKPVTGHCAGATPALEAIVSVVALERGFIPPTATCETPDPACRTDPVARVGRSAALRRVLSVSLGFWGYNAALLLRAPDA